MHIKNSPETSADLCVILAGLMPPVSIRVCNSLEIKATLKKITKKQTGRCGRASLGGLEDKIWRFWFR